MNTLLANTAIDLAIAALLSAIALAITNAAGWIAIRTKQAEQGAQLNAVTQQAQHTQDTVAATP